VRTVLLLEELRERDVLLEADGLPLHVNALSNTLTEQLQSAIREDKRPDPARRTGVSQTGRGREPWVGN
jgi:hypothetical protein